MRVYINYFPKGKDVVCMLNSKMLTVNICDKDKSTMVVQGKDDCDFGYCDNEQLVTFIADVLETYNNYTKQVRKEVCEQVYKVLEQAVPKDLCWSWDVIMKEFDKIQGEIK